MKTLKMKFKKSDDHTNIDKNRVASNIKEFYIISKLIFFRIKFIKKGNYFISKMNVNMSKTNMFKWTYGLLGHNYRVAAVSTLYLPILGVTIPSLKSIGQFLPT